MRSSALCIGIVLCLAASTFAAFPTGWDDAAINGGGSPTSNYTAVISDPDITLSETVAVSLGGAAAIAAYAPTPAYTDTLLVGSNVARNGGDSDCGVMLNYNSATMQGYVLTIDFQSGALDISSLDGGGAFTQLGHDNIDSFNADTTYLLEFTYKNGDMTGNVYDAGSVLRGTINVSNSTYTSGSVGVLASTNYTGGAGSGADSTRGAFTNFDVSEVPEPLTLLLLGGGLVAMRLRRRK